MNLTLWCAPNADQPDRRTRAGVRRNRTCHADRRQCAPQLDGGQSRSVRPSVRSRHPNRLWTNRLCT